MFFHTHVHSEFSCLDGMSDIAVMAEKAAKLGQPGIALTDHGNMSGVFQLYNEAKKHNLAPFLGLEAYVVDAIADKNAKRHHLSLRLPEPCQIVVVIPPTGSLPLQASSGPS